MAPPLSARSGREPSGGGLQLRGRHRHEQRDGSVETVIRVAKEDGTGWDMQIVEEPESFPDEFAPTPPVNLKEIWWKDERLVPLPPA